MLKEGGVFHIMMTVGCSACFVFFSSDRVKMVCCFGLETSFCTSWNSALDEQWWGGFNKFE